MASEEIGFGEVKRLARRSWKWALGLAATFGLTTFVVVSVVIPAVYTATARLVVFPHSEGQENAGSPIRLSLLESDGMLTRTTEALVAEGVLPEGATLVLGRELSSRVVPAGQGQGGGAVLVLTARNASPEKAATIANTWARGFVTESRNLPRSTAAETETLLVEQLAPARRQIEELEIEKSTALSELEKREEEVARRWDREIATAGMKAEAAIADHQGETRRLMAKSVARHVSDRSAVAARILEVVSVRSELAKTSRVVTLEKTASDEDLAEMILREKDAGYLDDQLISQEINLLYDQLSLKALELEGELKRGAGERLAEVSKALTDLEKIQRQRSVGFTALLGENSLVLRSLRRRRSFALRELARERTATVAEFERRLKQSRDLESRLATRLNTTVFSGLLEQTSRVSLVSPAAPRRVPVPRRRSVKVAVAILLGGMLGLTITLFRSPEGP